MRKIRISAEDVAATATLKDNATADAVWNALPIEAKANTWGDEIYFGIPVQLEEAEDARDVVDSGDLAYWPPGNAFCIFFGRTPASRGDEIRAASEVNVFGKLSDDPELFKRIPSGAKIRIEAI